MSTNQDINLIKDFLEKDGVFSLFQLFLEKKGIASTEAEGIIKTLEYEDVIELTSEELNALDKMLSSKPPIYIIN